MTEDSKVYTFPNNFQIRFIQKKRKKRKISIENLGQFDNKIIKIIVNEGMPHTNRFPEFKTT